MTELLVTVVGGLLLACAGKAYANWKGRKAAANVFYTVRKKEEGQ